jgi:hypothetical protein
MAVIVSISCSVTGGSSLFSVISGTVVVQGNNYKAFISKARAVLNIKPTETNFSISMGIHKPVGIPRGVVVASQL